MSKKMNNKKGITPVIAIVLLLMMTVAAAGLAYEFIMDMSEKQTEAIGEQVGAQSDKMRTDLRILQVQENIATPADLDFIIKNTGSVVMSSIDANVDYKVDDRIEASPAFYGDCHTSDSIEIGSTCTLSIPAEDLPVVGTTKTFEFILDNGYTLSYGCNVASTNDDFC